jgi:CBS domain-containing protein
MKKNEPVSHIMTSNVLTVDINQSLDQVEKIMTRNHIRHLPVVSGDQLVGMLSLTDLLRISFADSLGDNEADIDSAMYELLSIEQVMVNHPQSVEEDTTIKEVAEILSKREFHALPVTRSGKLSGIVTTTDLIKYLLAQY